MKSDFEKRKQLRFTEVNYLNYTKKDPILHVATTFFRKQGETRTSHGPIPHPLRVFYNDTLVIVNVYLEGTRKSDSTLIIAYAALR